MLEWYQRNNLGLFGRTINERRPWIVYPEALPLQRDGRLEWCHILRLRSDGLSGNINKILWLTKKHQICFELEQVHIWKLW